MLVFVVQVQTVFLKRRTSRSRSSPFVSRKAEPAVILRIAATCDVSMIYVRPGLHLASVRKYGSPAAPTAALIPLAARA